jgi:hypothetical protein
MEIYKIVLSFSKEGTFPLNLFPVNPSTFRFEALDIETGIDPVNWFPLTEKNLIFGRVILDKS